MLEVITVFLLLIPLLAILLVFWDSAGGFLPERWRKRKGSDTRLLFGLIQKRSREQKEKRATGAPVAKKTVIQIFFGALFFRLLVYLISYWIIGEQTSAQSAVSGAGSGAVTWTDFLGHWLRWDAGHYVDIAQYSYQGVLENGEPLMLVFFPLYPFLIRMLHWMTGDYAVAGLLLSVFSYAGGLCYLYLLTAREFGGRTARTAIILISIFPFSFFFGGVMTESLFLLTSTAALYYIRKRRYFPAALFGMAAGMTRMHGILLAAAMLAEMAAENQVFSREFWKKAGGRRQAGVIGKAAGYTGIMCLGPGVYLFINARVTGNPMQFRIYQKEHWFQGPGLVTDTIRYLYENTLSYSEVSDRMLLWFPELILFFFCVFFLWYGVKYLPAPFLLYFFLYFLMNYSVTWLLSAGRYMSLCVPMFLVIAIFVNKSNRRKYTVYLLFWAGFILFLNAFLAGKSVM